jgi:hypothetical protein
MRFGKLKWSGRAKEETGVGNLSDRVGSGRRWGVEILNLKFKIGEGRV